MRKIKKKKVSPSANHVLVLRTCDAEMKAYNRFEWPRTGPVKCPDWSPEAVCGRGLHGLLWGEGDGEQLNWNEGANWLVVRVLASDIVQLDRKVKFPAGEVVFCGDQNGATKYLLAAPEGRGRAISGAVVLAGRGEAATAGYKGTATAGYKGTATAGNWGTATAGESGTATAGESGTATAGKEGVLCIKWWDGKRYRLVVGYVGEDGIQADKYYRLDDAGKFIPAPDVDAAMAAEKEGKGEPS